MPATQAVRPREVPLFPRRFGRKPFVQGACAMLLALLLAPFTDITYHPIVELLRHLPASLVIAGREFPNTWAILAMGAMIYIYAPRKRKYFVWFLVAIAISSALNEIPKRGVGRARPRYSLMMKDENVERINAFRLEYPEGHMVPEKRDQWLFLSPRPVFYDGYASFPSGHTNSAFVLAAFLGVLFWRGRIIFLVLATACGIARVYQYRHFPEDVLFGGGLGWFVAHWVFLWAWPGRLAVWLDQRCPWMRLRTEGLRLPPASAPRVPNPPQRKTAPASFSS